MPVMQQHAALSDIPNSIPLDAMSPRSYVLMDGCRHPLALTGRGRSRRLCEHMGGSWGMISSIYDPAALVGFSA